METKKEMNPINYWYQKYLSIKKTLDCLIGDNDFIVVQKGEIQCSLSGKYELSARAKLPANQDLFKFGDKCKIIIVKP